MDAPTRTPWQKLVEFRILGIPLAGVIDAAPDFALAATFLYGALFPWRMGVAGMWWLEAVMAMEFLAIHSGAFTGIVMTADLSRRKRLWGILGLSLFYGYVAVAYSLQLRSWYPLVTFSLLTFNRASSVLLRDPRTDTDAAGCNDTFRWLFSFGAYMLSCILGLLVNAAFGQMFWSPAIHAAFFKGNASNQLDVFVLAGILYFTSQGICELLFMHTSKPAAVAAIRSRTSARTKHPHRSRTP